MAGLVSSLFIKLTADTTKFQTGMKGAERRLKASQKRFAAATKTVSKFAGALGLVVSAGTMVRFSRDAIMMGSRLDDTSKKLGVATEQLQIFGFAARESGIRTEAAELGLQRFTRRLAEAQAGTGEMLPIIKEYNIALENSDGTARSAGDVLRDYADALRDAKTPQEQLRLAFKAFDSEGAALVSVLRDGAEGLDAWADAARNAGQIMSAETIAALADAENRLEQLNIRTTIWTGNLLKLVSTLGDLARAMPAFTFSGVLAPFGGLGAGAGAGTEIPDAAKEVGEAIKQSREEINAYNISLQRLVGTESELRAELQFKSEIYRELAQKELFRSGRTEEYIKLLSEAVKAEQEMLKLQTPLQKNMALFANTIEDGLVSAAAEGKTAFADMAQHIIAQIQRMMIRMALFKAFSGLGGFFSARGNTGLGNALSDFGSNFGGERALGGPVSKGKSYLVGERGPELVTMGASGNVTPNGGFGGGMIVNADMRGASADAVARLELFVAQMAGDMRRVAIDAVGDYNGRDPNYLG